MNTAAIVLAAGAGTRMKSKKPKVAHEILGKPLVRWVVDAAREAGADRIVSVVGARSRDRGAFGVRHRVVVQRRSAARPTRCSPQGSARRLRWLAACVVGRLPAYHARYHSRARRHARPLERGGRGAHHGARRPVRLRAHHPRRRRTRRAHRRAEGRERRRGRRHRMQLWLLLLRRAGAFRGARTGGQRQRAGRVLPDRRARDLPWRRARRACASRKRRFRVPRRELARPAGRGDVRPAVAHQQGAHGGGRYHVGSDLGVDRPRRGNRARCRKPRRPSSWGKPR